MAVVAVRLVLVDIVILDSGVLERASFGLAPLRSRGATESMPRPAVAPSTGATGEASTTRTTMTVMLSLPPLFLQLNNLQVLQAKKLANAPGNVRQVINAFSLPRGAILAMVSNPGYDPTPLASHSGATEQAAWKSLISNHKTPPLRP